MARRKGLRVTCAVCSRVFYLETWGEQLPEHSIGRGGAPICSGSRRSDYVPASNGAVVAQMDWAAGRLPDPPKRAPSKDTGRSKVVAAQRTDEKRLRTQLAKASSDLDDLLKQGLDLQRRRGDSEDEDDPLKLLGEHEELLRSERRLRVEIARAEQKLKKLEGD